MTTKDTKPKNRTSGRALLVALALVPWIAGVAIAATVENRYAPVRNTPNANGSPSTTALASHRTIVDGAEDSTTNTTPIDPQPTGGDTQVVVAPRFSVQGASCQCELWLYQKIGDTYTFMGIADVQTATAGDGSMARRAGASGDYLPLRPLYFDTAGADAYDPRYPAVSSGTVNSFAWTNGAQSRAAQ
jgi:hypothetical protein